MIDAGAVGGDAAAGGDEAPVLEGLTGDGGVVLAGDDGVEAGEVEALDRPVVARGDDVVAGPGVDGEQQAGVVGEREVVADLVLDRLVLVDGDRLVGAQAVGAVDDDQRGAALVDRRLDEGVDVGEVDDLGGVGADGVGGTGLGPLVMVMLAVTSVVLATTTA
jgi:hypothetical protein